MRKPAIVATLAATSAAAAALAVTTPAVAINSYNAEPTDHTEVGAFMALWDRTGDGVPDRFDWICSGTMVDDDTFLTAAHCTDDWPEGTRFYVSLEEDVQTLLDDTSTMLPAVQAGYFVEQGWAVEGTPHQDPAFPGNSSDSHDIGVLDFADRDTTPQDVWDFEPATLPTAGQLDALGGRELDRLDWFVVGYGTQETPHEPGGPYFPGGGVRLQAPLDFNALNKTWVRLAMNESRGLGGACYGDSGGPNFVTIDGHDVLAATTITGDAVCYATNVTYRMDTQSARAFLAPYVDLP